VNPERGGGSSGRVPDTRAGHQYAGRQARAPVRRPPGQQSTGARGWDRMGTTGKGAWVVGGRWRTCAERPGLEAGARAASQPRAAAPAHAEAGPQASSGQAGPGVGAGMGMMCASDHVGRPATW
jgi:hypothetical protein